jgi:hypothetical protein
MKVRDLIISLVSGVCLAIIFIHNGVMPKLSAAIDGTQSQLPRDGFRPVSDTDTDPFSWQIKELMLNSHDYWRTLQVEATTTWYREGKEDFQVFTHAQIEGKDYVRFDMSQTNSEEPYLWLLNGSELYETNFEIGLVERSGNSVAAINHDYTMYPQNINAINTNVVYRHPIAMRVSSPVANYIYPTGFAQRANGFSLLGEETIAGRETWLVEWVDEAPSSLRQLFWVDSQTGMILKTMSYYGKNLDRLVEETVFTKVVFDEPISHEVFDTTSYK